MEKSKENIGRGLLVIIILSVILILYIYIRDNIGYIFVRNDDLVSSKVKEVYIKNKIYYEKLNHNYFNGGYKQYDIRILDNQDFKNNNIMKVVSYSEYQEIIDSVNRKNYKKIEKYYSDSNSNYIILGSLSSFDFELVDCVEGKDVIFIYGDEDNQSIIPIGRGYLIVIPTKMPLGTKIEYRECFSKEEIKNLKRYSIINNPLEYQVDKPIIYLYPKEETKISVKLGNPERITCSYPKYLNNWEVLAKNSGELVDLKTNRKLYALYYECDPNYDFKIEKDGFIVSKENLIEFFEEKLEILGLTEKESEEFIIYWLPKLQRNKYNYIRFATSEEIEKNMPIDFSVKPDTLIRILMTYKGLDEKIEVLEQKLEKINRNGFVAVEWGGTEIK